MFTDELQAKMTRYARFTAKNAVTFTADDLFQDAAVALLEAAQKNASFAEQKASYIGWRVGWIVKQSARSDRCHTDRWLADGLPTSYAKNHQRRQRPIEELAEAAEHRVRVRKALFAMTPHQERIARLLMQGEKVSVIARRMGTSRQAVYQAMERMSQTLPRE